MESNTEHRPLALTMRAKDSGSCVKEKEREGEVRREGRTEEAVERGEGEARRER